MTAKSALSKTFMILAGGTGGHVYPALSFAALARQKGHSVSWLGTRAGLEAVVVPAHAIELNTVDIEGVRGRGITTLIAAPFKILGSLVQARSILKRVKPDLVIGFGGYSAGPGGLAARLSGIPLVIHEQNAIAGTTNKLLSRIAARRLCAFEGALSRSELVGNPVRPEILDIENNRQPIKDRATGDRGRCRVLVTGGSLGARFLNETLPVAVSNLDHKNRPIVRHQAGPRWLNATIESYRAAGVEAEVTAYIEDMASAYQWADLAVCRAGAMTVSELAVAGVASLLVPFPFAIDDHQTANAHWLADAGAAVIYQQSQNDPDEFARRFTGLIEDRELLSTMARRARSGGLRDAAGRMLNICENLLDGRGVADVA